MADNVPITAGIGTPIATDEIGGIHYQLVKLVDGTDGNTQVIKGDTANGLDVDVTRLPTLASVTTLGTITNVVHVDDNAGSLTVDGTVAVSSLPALVAGTANIGVVTPHALASAFVSGATASITDTTNTSVIAADATLRIYVTSLLVTNSHATVGTFVNITDGSGGAVLWTGYAAAVGGGFACTFPTPIKTTAATALFCVCVTTGASVRVCAAGYKAA